jgi:hypothetical protein
MLEQMAGDIVTGSEYLPSGDRLVPFEVKLLVGLEEQLKSTLTQ